MAVTRSKIRRSPRKSLSAATAIVRGGKAPSRRSKSGEGDRMIRTLQQRLLGIVSGSEEEGRSPVVVAAGFVQAFRQLTKTAAVAIYLRDEQTREMICLAEAGGSDASATPEWQELLAKAEQDVRVACGELRAFRLHRIGRLEGLVVISLAGLDRRAARVIGTVVGAVEPWLAVALDHARLTRKYAAKILRIQNMEQVSDLLNSSLPESDKLRHALEAAVRLVEAEAGALFLAGDDGTLTLCAMGGERGAAGLMLQSPSAVEVFRKGQPLLLKQENLAPWVSAPQGWQSVFPVTSLVSVPIRAGSRSVGVLEVANRRSGKPFSNWDVLELASLSNQFGLAIDNLRRSR